MPHTPNEITADLIRRLLLDQHPNPALRRLVSTARDTSAAPPLNWPAPSA
ncbi:hypothetical protein AB0A71_07860 [Kitasatospora aureofaciens]